MFAVIRTGGKQYRVTENEVLKVEKLEAEAGINYASGMLENSPPRPFWLLLQLPVAPVVPSSAPCWFISPKIARSESASVDTPILA